MTAACQWPTPCTGHAGQRGFSRGYCRTHYLRLYRAGRIRPRFIPGSLVQARLEVYKTRHRSLRTAAVLTGIDHRTLSDLAAGRIAKARPEVARAVLTAPLPPTDVGCVRRVQALLSLGHAVVCIADDMGYRPGSVLAGVSRQRFGDRLALALYATYERMSGSVGMGRRLNHPPPLAWHDVDIDDPAAIPDTGPPSKVTAADRVAEVEHLTSLGVAQDVACKQVGIKPATLNSLRWRIAQRPPAPVTELRPPVSVCACGTQLTAEQIRRRWTECLACWRQSSSSDGAA